MACILSQCVSLSFFHRSPLDFFQDVTLVGGVWARELSVSAPFDNVTYMKCN